MYNEKVSKEYYQKHKEKIKAYKKEYYQRKALRIEALEIVGKHILKCFNCGCDDIRVLQINHIDGNGSKEFREVGSKRFYRNIIDGLRSTKDLNILCKVCNVAHFVKLRYGLEFKVSPLKEVRKW